MAKKDDKEPVNPLDHPPDPVYTPPDESGGTAPRSAQVPYEKVEAQGNPDSMEANKEAEEDAEDGDGNAHKPVGTT